MKAVMVEPGKPAIPGKPCFKLVSSHDFFMYIVRVYMYVHVYVHVHVQCMSLVSKLLLLLSPLPSLACVWF